MTIPTLVESAGDGFRAEKEREKGSDPYERATECCDRAIEQLGASIAAVERLERLLSGEVRP
jgi:hypothetical protein